SCHIRPQEDAPWIVADRRLKQRQVARMLVREIALIAEMIDADREIGKPQAIASCHLVDVGMHRLVDAATEADAVVAAKEPDLEIRRVGDPRTEAHAAGDG